MSNNVVDIVVQLTDKNAKAGLEKIAATSKGTVAELSKLKNEMFAIGASAGLAGLGSKLAKEALAWNLSVKKMQSLTGATAEQASTFLSVANYMGVATDVSTVAFAKFAKAVSNAQDKMQVASAEGKLATDMFSRLGVSIDQIEGKNTLEVFKIIQDRLRNMKDGAEKTRVEMELFGKTGYQLHGMLNMSADAMKQVEDRARAMGLIIDDEAAKKSAAFNRQLKDMEQTGKRLAIMIGQELLPVVMEYAQGAIDLTKSYSNLATEQKEAIAGLIKFGLEATIVITGIQSVTSALKFMRLATIAAAGPWITLATVAGLAAKSIYSAVYASKTAGTDLGVDVNGLRAHKNLNAPGTSSDYMDNHDGRYWVEDSSLFGLIKNDRLATKEEGAQIDAAIKAKEAADAAKKNAEEEQERLQKEIDDAKNGLTNNDVLNKLSGGLEDGAKAQEKAAKEQAQAAEKMSQAADRLTDLIKSLTLQSLEIDGSQYEIDKAQARNQFDSNTKNILSILQSAAGISSSGSASGVLEAANAQLGKAYVLGADGDWATDCGKLFADSVKATFGKDVPRYVPSIMDAAAEAGAWHPEGDGYVPKAGDGVVVLGDNHIVIADGNGGYTGANSSTGVVAKQSITGDFGAITGYVDTSKLAGISGGSTYSQANAKALASSNLVAEAKAKNEEVYQKKLEEADRNQKIRVRKMNEEISKLDLERTGDRLQLLKTEAEAQKAQIDDNVREYTKAVGDKTLAEKRANAEKLKITADTEQKIRELAYTQLNEDSERQSNLVRLGRISQSDADQVLNEQLRAYIEFAQRELNEAQLSATQRLQVEKNLVEAQQKLWEIAGRNLRTSLAEGARQYSLEVVNYGDLAKSTFDSTMSSINSSFTSHLENIATGAESFGKGLKNIFKDITNSIIKMLVNLSFQQYVQPKLQSLFGGVVSGIGAIGAGRGGVSSFASGGSFSSAFTGNSFGKFASGGIAPAGMTLVGENGPELLQFNSSHRIYNASQTRKMISGEGASKVTVNIINQSGQQLDSQQQETKFDGEQMIVDVVVSSLMTNKGGMRDAIKAAAV
ncbi:MAG: phage tail protein [Veillonella sp.]|uniref:phage tail protein n=1 Tax=Veillonella sp. TaxID=1926307 RepID=UPI00290862E1|nr:phage tail protein [Veillonella sp.]MDU5003006.1 phage tail protein [Veillonella sp.]